MQQHVQLHCIDRPVDAGHAPAAVCSVRAKMTVSAVAVAGHVRGAGDAPCVSNMSTPASSSTVSTAAMMVVISASRWANMSADQQQLQQVATADGRLGGSSCAPVRVHGGGRISLQSMSDCWIAHSTMPCVRSTPVRLAPAPRRARHVPFLVVIVQNERFVTVLYGCHLSLAYG